MRRYQEPVYRVSYLIVRDTHLAEAATLSTFVRAYRALPSYDKELGLLPWFIRIAAGESRQQRRESGRPTPSSRPIERSSGPHVPSTPIAGMAQASGLTLPEREAIGSGFDRLGEDDRLVIATRYLLGLRKADAAKALSLSPGLLEERLETAVKRLRARMAGAPAVESQPGSLTGLSEDRLATTAVSLVLSELEWAPDIAPAVLDRISRDAVAYPEQFDRRPVAPRRSLPPAAGGRSARRTAGRLAVFGVMLVVIVALVLFAATVNAASFTVTLAGDATDTFPCRPVPAPSGCSAARMPIGAMRGTLVSSGVDVAGGHEGVDHGDRVLLVVTEAS